MKLLFVFLLGLLCLWVLSGCATEAQITEHIMATLTASALTATAQPTALPPAASPTQAPTATTAPTATPSPAPQPTSLGPPIVEPGDFEGSFALGFEVVSFRPCGLDENWWVTFSSTTSSKDLYARYAALTKKMEPLHVRFRGLAGELGHYGHLGAYDREFELQQIKEMRTLRPGDCK